MRGGLCLDRLLLLLLISSLKDGYQILSLEYELTQIYKSTSRDVLTFETRRVQSNGRSLVTVIPKPYTDFLEIEKGDLIKFHLQKNPIGRNKIIIEKVDLDNNDSIA